MAMQNSQTISLCNLREDHRDVSAEEDYRSSWLGPGSQSRLFRQTGRLQFRLMDGQQL
jgi:hypothetical protein